ncbi:unnamed protein product [Rotaria magnacalcarata]|uniref:Uncharacterized protein n=2 Tax=Rotaria magnacalcarata TaxID=392030 RepID=A0A820DFE9_9BILA|nr:unnamed protein product [Rotaria magnacalcarata]
MHPDAALYSDDIISCDRTIKNEIKRLADNERLLFKDRLVEAMKYGGVCTSPDIWSDKTTIEASQEIDSEIEMTDDEDDYDRDVSQISDDDMIDYSSTTIYNLPQSAKEIVDTTRHCKVLVKYIKKTNLNRHIQMVEEDNYSPTADEDEKQKQFSKFTTLHQCSVVRWLSLHDLLSSIEKVYYPLKHMLNERTESSRLEKINMSIVTQLIKFLKPWKYVMNGIQLSNSPSLFITLPCIGYLKQQIKKSERIMKGGMSFFIKRSLHLLESMFKTENLHVTGTFLHPNYKQLRYATQIQIIECHTSCRLAIPTSSTLTYSNCNDDNDINEPPKKKPKRFLESLIDDITSPVVLEIKDEVDAYIDL